MKEVTERDFYLMINNPDIYFLLEYPDEFMKNQKAKRRHNIFMNCMRYGTIFLLVTMLIISMII